MLQLTEDDLWEGISAAERKEIPLEDFAWPEERKYPIDSQEHLDSAAKLLGHAPEAKQGEIKARAIRIARRKGFTLPDSWKEEHAQESAATIVDVGQRPKKKIATLKVCFLEYGARSQNGRIYPRATCDAIFRAAQQKVSRDDLPATVFVSHEAANSNGNMELVGRVARVWQEGQKFYADLDLADTRAARDMLALAEGGYLRSESMRVAGVQLVHDRNYDLPLVVPQEGAEVDFLGIDLTTRPGLADSARILQTLYESSGQQAYMEEFTLENVLIESREVPPAMTIPIYVQVALGTLEESSSKEAHMRVHDHVAAVMDECFGPKHGSESARLKALIEGQLDEAGKAIAMKHAARLAAVHDESAKQCNMKCESCYSDMVPGNAPSDTDGDGDDPAHGIDPDADGESHKTPPALTETQEDTTLTPEQMIEALKKSGFKIEAPKSEAEKLAEQEAKLAALEAKVQQLSESAPGQRQTLAAPSQLEESTLQEEALYEEGDYLAGDLAPRNWKSLANRRVPWPKDIDPKLALHEMAPFLTANLLQQEANAMGRSLDAFIGAHERI